MIVEPYQKVKTNRTLSKKEEQRENALTEIIQDGGQLDIEDESTSRLVEMLKAEKMVHGGLPAIVSSSE